VAAGFVTPQNIHLLFYRRHHRFSCRGMVGCPGIGFLLLLADFRGFFMFSVCKICLTNYQNLRKNGTF